MSKTTKRPFSQRAYAGFTPAQQGFYERLLRPGQAVLDPMGGQAFALAEAADEGRTVTVGDVNMGPLLLASLRDPMLCRKAEEMGIWLEELLRSFPIRRTSRPEYSDAWLCPSVAADLERLGAGIGLVATGDGRLVHDLTERQRFALAIATYAAREIACFRSTDNATWTKPGGLVREPGIVPPMLVALAEWRDYARAEALRRGVVSVMQMSATGASRVKADLVVTSPPYANRLDYARMWGPEVALLDGVPGARAFLSDEAVATNAVKGWDRRLREPALLNLPQSTQAALADIEADDAPYSATYYFPYFARYALDLARAMARCVEALREGGALVVFIRDTVRRDVLLSSADVVRHTINNLNMRTVTSESVIVRRHIGLRRRNGPASMHGLAQREWFLQFEKDAS